MTLTFLFASLITLVTGAKDAHTITKKYSPFPGTPGMSVPQYQPLCAGRDDEFILLPWDCTGYVWCTRGRANWRSCPIDPRSLAGQREPVCLVEEAMCQMKERARWHEFCGKLKQGRFPSRSSCAAYYDCSLDGVERWCTYPGLFNPTSGQCEDFHNVEPLCGPRPVPVDICDYQSPRPLCAEPDCPRCPSCIGLPDGVHAVPGTVDYPWYLVCDNSRVLEMPKCPDGRIFSNRCLVCTFPDSTRC